MFKPPHVLALRAGVISLVASSILCAQAVSPDVQNAPKSVLDGFQTRAATLQDLSVPQQQNIDAFKVSVRLGNQLVTLQLEARDIRAKDFKLYVSDDQGLHEVPRPVNTSYRGQVAGFPNSLVRATLYNGQLSAVIGFIDDQPMWNVEPLTNIDKAADKRTHVVLNARDTTTPPVSCGTADKLMPTTTAGRPVLNGSAGARNHLAEIGIDCDNYFYSRNGSSVPNCEAAVNRVMNGVEAIYKRDVNIEYSITAIIVRKTRVYTGTDTGTLLGQMRSRWNARHGSIRRDLAHMFTGVGSFSGVIGTAYLSVVCTTSGYGVSKAFHSSTTTNVGLVAHECGHNWGSNHCNSAPPCYIMCSGLGGCNRSVTLFGAFAKTAIGRHRDSRSCLDVSPFLRIGGGISGIKGNPRFTGEGFINSTANPPKITLSNYRNNALGVFIIGVKPIKLPYLGGTLIPQLDVAAAITGSGADIVLDASALKTLSLNNLWVQAFYLDAAATQGASATSGYRIFIR